MTTKTTFKTTAFRIEIWLERTNASHSLGVFHTWTTPLLLIRAYVARPISICHFYERGLGRVVQVHIGKAVAVRKAMIDLLNLTAKPGIVDISKLTEIGMNQNIERTIVVEGHRLTKTAVEKAYAELQKPEPLKAGDIVRVLVDGLRGVLGTKRYVVIDGNVVENIDLGLKQYGETTSLGPNTIRYTDGTQSYTRGSSESLVKVGTLQEGE